jgi:intein-encoded DNA endonuclease-like protein
MSILDTEIGNLLLETEKRFSDLVHYGRTVCELDSSKPYITIKREKCDLDVISERYRAEVARLRGEDPQWEQGFNSGCLAMVRLIMETLDVQSPSTKERIKNAIDEFPDLLT